MNSCSAFYSFVQRPELLVFLSAVVLFLPVLSCCSEQKHSVDINKGKCGIAESLPPVRAITGGPKFHWFGYYDKLEFDTTNRYVLGIEVDFEHRIVGPSDVVKIGMVDLQDGDKWIEVGESRAWSWQQGCMLQWRPGTDTEILWNDCEGQRFVCRILDVKTKQKSTVPFPIYTVSGDGRTAVTTDFRRLQDTRPGYGYAGVPDPYKDELAPKESGIWKVDLDSGEAELIISLADIVTIADAHNKLDEFEGAKHWFNHLLFNTDGSRFIFLHRWSPRDGSHWKTRLLTASHDGKDIRVVDPYGRTSHFIWRDASHILAWAWHRSNGRAFYLYEDGTDKVEAIGKDVMTTDGHCSYLPLPGGEWILNDTYPQGEMREQFVYLYHIATNRRIELGRFHQPIDYRGQWRCDTHPRFSRDGQSVVIDSPHGGNGRQLYLIDISEIVGEG